MREKIEEGFEVFVADGDKAVGAVRQVSPELVIYIENAGDFTVPPEAVKAVHDEKVVLERSKLDQQLRRAISHAHDAEDPNI